MNFPYGQDYTYLQWKQPTQQWGSLLGGIDVKYNGYTLKGITIFDKSYYSKRLSGEDFNKAYNLHYQAHFDWGSSPPQ